MSGRFFYIADCAILFDYEKIDGIVEHIWQGPVHIHGTVTGGIKRDPHDMEVVPIYSYPSQATPRCV